MVLNAKEAETLLQSEAAVETLLGSILAQYGNVSVSFLLIGLERHLMTQDRRQREAAMRTGAVQPV